jgi:hypothetical protein
MHVQAFQPFNMHLAPHVLLSQISLNSVVQKRQQT